MIHLINIKQFTKVYNDGVKFFSKNFLIYFYRNDYNENRLGFVTSKKVGNAVKRNRIRRLFRETYRLNENIFPKGYDIVFIAKRNFGRDIKTVNYNILSKEVIKLLKRVDIK
ncbi:ribonuclease P protein component [Haliovirga abyssi]|uniref:Ribonuclease P protein component n=1 Tax=Haliovirga abyssi TaxID=2996794 RepID=A0AAU9D694_9FUSO|nr:ribonuclease P protein component [Haliovirga abyssi]BDU51499.1 ribonuclease P protein component [Haliovirga abyssi]